MAGIKSLDVIKNNRFRTLCTGTLFLNPHKTINNLVLNKDGVAMDNGLFYVHAIEYPSGSGVYPDSGIYDYDVIAFGGQVAGFAIFIDYELHIILPVDAYNYYSSTDISSMIKSNDTLFAFRPTFDSDNSSPSGYAYGISYTAYNFAELHTIRVTDDGGGGYDIDNISDFISSISDCYAITEGIGEATNIVTNAEIKNVLISDYSVVKNEANYGHHQTVYNSKNTYTAKLRLPYKTPVEKIDQLMQSKHIVFMMDNRTVEYGTYTVPTFDNIQKPLGGGSISPMMRSLSIVSGTLTEKIRRGYYEVDVILHG